jgi:hypothetical protein
MITSAALKSVKQDTATSGTFETKPLFLFHDVFSSTTDVRTVRQINEKNTFPTSKNPVPSVADPHQRMYCKYFKPKKLFLSSRNMIRDVIPDADLNFTPIPDPGVKKAPDPQHCP